MRLPKRLLLAAGLGAVAARRAFNAPYDLQGRSVLITGGSRGLGLMLARELCSLGAAVTLMARHADALERAAEDLRSHGARVHTVAGDVTIQADVDRAVQETVRVHGGLDVLVSNAGIIQTGPLANMTEGDFREIMEINAFATLRLTRAALPYLRGRQGRVLVVGSVGSRVAVPHLGPYCMSKFAVAGLAQALRAELAREGVTVTAVHPSLMRTGSPRHAQVKGQHKKEYALFATLDNLPVLSLDAPTAARRMIAALVRGDAEVMIGGPALMLRYVQALAPQLTADVLALSNRLLPAPASSDRMVLGAQAESDVTRRNPLKRRAESEFNEL
ncbi:SDR family oxidoreductase [Deinococcus deserti]|uniref:Putative Short-chain dehydrogenase n=1 Tax=Deinococcus deserti (strain DSM 17065 / CIP 109153 / LMG 22923 / VCD115) TaxID=546414 RepID=C1CWA7_DEIDV|nr:SDR family oxidoreductase [Deinococcus deserti]ACO46474.1 putative Short-chain dehydrogenase [Deinococcus deserti VCD115]